MKKSYKIIFLGNTSVGKTMLIYRYISDGFAFPEPTIGIDFFSNTLDVNGQNVKLQLWDTAGQERYKSIITPYIRDSFLAVVVYAVNNRNSFNQLKYWIELFQSKSNNKKARIVIVANKKDLWTNVEIKTNDEPSGSRKGKNKAPDSNYVLDSEGREFAAKHNAKFCTSSALEKAEIVDLSQEIKSAIADDLEHPQDPDDAASNVNMLQAKRNNRGCC